MNNTRAGYTKPPEVSVPGGKARGPG